MVQIASVPGHCSPFALGLFTNNSMNMFFSTYIENKVLERPLGLSINYSCKEKLSPYFRNIGLIRKIRLQVFIYFDR